MSFAPLLCSICHKPIHIRLYEDGRNFCGYICYYNQEKFNMFDSTQYKLFSEVRLPSKRHKKPVRFTAIFFVGQRVNGDYQVIGFDNDNTILVKNRNTGMTRKMNPFTDVECCGTVPENIRVQAENEDYRMQRELADRKTYFYHTGADYQEPGKRVRIKIGPKTITWEEEYITNLEACIDNVNTTPKHDWRYSRRQPLAGMKDEQRARLRTMYNIPENIL